VTRKPGINSTELQQSVGGSKADVAAARRELIDEGLIEVITGKRGALSFFPGKLATSPKVAETSQASSGDVDAPAYISGAYTDNDMSQISYLLPKCEVHDYSTITAFDMRITLCGDCFDVSQSVPMGGI
jgi:hypothetical protein